jgi:hypothetical protein
MYCLWRLSRGEGFIYVLPVEVIKRRGVYICMACYPLITSTGNTYINPSPLDNLHRQYIYKPLSS